MFLNPNVFQSLWREMNGLRSEADRFFGRAVAQASGAPALNVWEDDAAYFVEADLPQVAPESIDVTVKEGNQLSISGERKANEPANAVWHRQERFVGTFARELTLPTPVDADNVQATYELGVLRLTLPKSAAARPRKIAIKAE